MLGCLDGGVEKERTFEKDREIDKVWRQHKDPTPNLKLKQQVVHNLFAKKMFSLRPNSTHHFFITLWSHKPSYKPWQPLHFKWPMCRGRIDLWTFWDSSSTLETLCYGIWGTWLADLMGFGGRVGGDKEDACSPPHSFSADSSTPARTADKGWHIASLLNNTLGNLG